MFNQGISREGDFLDVGTEMGIVEKRGAFFAYNETRLGQGRENAKNFLQENPALALEIENAIRQRAELPLKGAPSTVSAVTAVPSEPPAPRKGKRGAAPERVVSAPPVEEPAPLPANGAPLEVPVAAGQYAQASLVASDEDMEL